VREAVHECLCGDPSCADSGLHWTQPEIEWLLSRRPRPEFEQLQKLIDRSRERREAMTR
jgi:hypothetical protein